MTRTRDAIELDLPFHVNGTLDPAQSAEIEAWLAEDAQLDAERAALAAIRDGMQAQDIRSPGDLGLARLMRDVGHEAAASAPPAGPRRTWVWQAVAAIAVAGFVTQAFWPGAPRAPEGDYRMASAVMPGGLVVAFLPDATESAIRDLLLSAGLEIVSGPSALGFYRLAGVEGGDLTAAAEALRAATTVVESVQNAQN